MIESKNRSLPRSPQRAQGEIGFDTGPITARKIWSAMIERGTRLGA